MRQFKAVLIAAIAALAFTMELQQTSDDVERLEFETRGQLRSFEGHQVLYRSLEDFLAESESQDLPFDAGAEETERIVQDMLQQNPAQAYGCLLQSITSQNHQMFSALLNVGVSPIHVTPDGQSLSPPLFAAIAYGNTQALRRLLDSGIDPNILGCPEGGLSAAKTPLVYATELKQTECVQLLLDTGKVNFNIKHPVNPVTPGQLAFAEGNFPIVKAILGHPDYLKPDLTSSDDEYDIWEVELALRSTVYSENVEALRFVLDTYGFAVEDENGVWKGDLLNSARRGIILRTFAYASSAGNYNSTKLLSGYLLNPDGRPFPELASMTDDFKSGKLHAISGRKEEAYRLLADLEDLSLSGLRTRDDARDDAKHLTRCLCMAVRTGSLSIVQDLVEQRHADINKGDAADYGGVWEEGLTPLSPLQLAAGFGHLEVVAYLLQQPEIDMFLGSGITPGNKGTALYRAARNGHEKIVKEVLRNGGPISKIIPDEMPDFSLDDIVVDVMTTTIAEEKAEVNLMWTYAKTAKPPVKVHGERYLRLKFGQEDGEWWKRLQFATQAAD